MSRLFESLFGRYGRVGKSPSVGGGTYQWANYCYLDLSFEFLLEKPARIPADILSDDDLFLAFLAGYLDAEGNFRIYPDGDWAGFALRVNSEDEYVLRDIATRLRSMGYHVFFKLAVKHELSNKHRRDVWSLGMFRKTEILRLVKRLPLVHEEKIRWSKLMIEHGDARWSQVEDAVSQLRTDILKERTDYSAVAESAYKKSHLAETIAPVQAP